ncbi:hypothetical protein D9M73_169100 [compost metagenome]
MANGRRCLPHRQTMLLRLGNWAPVPGWHWARKATWPAGSKTASGNWGCVVKMAVWSVSPVPTHAFAAWPWTANTCMPSPRRPSAPRQSLPLTAATMKYACWPVVPKCCRQGKSACRSRSITTVAASRPMVSSTRQRSRKAPHRWWCSSTAGQPQPVIPCSTRVSSIGPSAALPWPTSTTGAAPAMVGNTARHCTSAGARAMWPMPAR